MSHGPAKTLQKYTLSTKYLYVRKDLPAFPIVNTESRDFIAAKVDGFMVLNIYRPNSGLIEELWLPLNSPMRGINSIGPIFSIILAMFMLEN